jgi:hypothetical protein
MNSCRKLPFTPHLGEAELGTKLNGDILLFKEKEAKSVVLLRRSHPHDPKLNKADSIYW